MSKKKERGEDSALPNGYDTQDTARDPGSRAGPDALRGGEGPADEAAPGPLVDGEQADARAALEAESAGLRDRLLRTQADFENYRKRMLREREESARYANAVLLADLLAVVDDFERAIKSAEESRDFDVFLEGVSMIERRMLEMLEGRWGLKRFTSVGEPFDPVRHEAMMRTEAPPGAAGAGAGPLVVEEFQKGYFLHERVLRPAKVRVQVPAEQGREPGGDAGSPPG